MGKWRIATVRRPSWSTGEFWAARIIDDDSGVQKDCHHTHSTQVLAAKCATKLIQMEETK